MYVAMCCVCVHACVCVSKIQSHIMTCRHIATVHKYIYPIGTMYCLERAVGLHAIQVIIYIVS